MRLLTCACFGLLAGTSLSAQLQFLNPNADWSSQPAVMATDGAGNMYVVSNSETDPYGYSYGITATKRDGSNGVVYSFSFAGQQVAAPLAAAVDSQGSLFIGGWTDSATFPQVNAVLHPSWAPFVNGRIPRQGFLVKIDPAGTKLLFSTLVGGNDISVPYAVNSSGYFTSVTALALDRAGNVYAAGGTTSPTFPVSSGAFQKKGGGLSDPTQTDNSDVRTSSFLIKISGAGGAVLYSTYLGGRARTCAFPQGAECAATVVSAVVVDDQSRATVAGLTVQPDFPVTPGAFQTDCHCDYSHNSLFVSRFQADGSALEWSTFLGSYGYLAGDIFGPAFGVVGLVLNAQGDATVAGVTYSSAFPVTSGAIQGAYPVGPLEFLHFPVDEMRGNMISSY